MWLVECGVRLKRGERNGKLGRVIDGCCPPIGCSSVRSDNLRDSGLMHPRLPRDASLSFATHSKSNSTEPNAVSEMHMAKKRERDANER